MLRHREMYISYSGFLIFFFTVDGQDARYVCTKVFYHVAVFKTGSGQSEYLGLNFSTGYAILSNIAVKIILMIVLLESISQYVLKYFRAICTVYI